MLTLKSKNGVRLQRLVGAFKSLDKSLRHLPSRSVQSLLDLLGIEMVRLWPDKEQSVYLYESSTSITEIRELTLNYVDSMRILRNGEFGGYQYSKSAKEPVLYNILAALLIKHLYGATDERCKAEIQSVLQFQDDDGIFRDPVIACPQAEQEDWWGWRHLTLLALMTLGLYGVTAQKEIIYLKQYKDPAVFKKHLSLLDWGAGAAWTSNAIQNLGVMLQYARDYQASAESVSLLDILFETLDERQDPQTGLYGDRFQTPDELSNGVQAGYHFWLLYFYEKRPVHYIEQIIDSVLNTQNVLGGFGVRWNSSACEDIDSIDPLIRFTQVTDYRKDEIQSSLRLALPAILQNLNGDGGWVFRRHEPFTYGFSQQMYSYENESNLFFTWFRTLGLAYCLSGLEKVPAGFSYAWSWGWAPGHQLL